MRFRIIVIWGLSALCFFSFYTKAQQVGVGEWRYHTPFHKSVSMAVGDNKVFCASENGIFFFNKLDNTINHLTRIEGLSDIGISVIQYSEQHKQLIIGYSNGNIDLVSSENVFNMRDIRRSDITGSKQINSIEVTGDYAYVSCGFGVVVLDLAKKEIKDTYKIGPNGDLPVNDVAVFQNYIYAATNSGLYMASAGSPNLNYYNEWAGINDIPDTTMSELFVFGGKLHVNFKNPAFNSDTVYVFDGQTWQKLSELYGVANNGFSVLDNTVTVAHNYGATIYDTVWKQIKSIFSYNGQSSPEPQKAMLDPDDQNIIWIADKNKGLARAVNSWSAEIMSLEGANSNKVHQIRANKGDIWAASGSVKGNLWFSTYTQDGVFLFRDEHWSSYRKGTVSGIDSLYDFLSVAIDPEDDNHIFFGAHGRGIAEIQDGKHKNTFGADNSSLQLSEKSGPGYRFTGVSDLSFDGNGNLWAANSGATNILCAKDKNDNWYSFDLASATNDRLTGSIMCTSGNVIWVLFPTSTGIVVYDYNNSLADKSDDRMRNLTSSAGLPNNEIFSVAEDKDGEIWVGTSKGIAVFYNPGDLFSDNPGNAETIQIQHDGQTGLLLQTETVTAIAIDGANRKWVGTSTSGVFLVAEDGTEELLHFNTDNSPILANAIKSIGINAESGEVFFGTEKGICSYRGTATEGNETYTDVYAYPNPVEPSYTGPIAITGLIENSNVKITDISGNLIFETTSNGGQAIWNGTTNKGSRVKTGVYLVFCTTNDGSQSIATKILFIN